MKVLLFEKGELGGVCLNRGCIPMKSFLYCSDIWNRSRYWKAGEEPFALRQAVEYGRGNVEKLKKNLAYMLNRDSIEVRREEVRDIRKKQKFELETEQGVYRADELVVAVGSEECVPSIDGLRAALGNGTAVLGSELFAMEEIPQNVAMVPVSRGWRWPLF